MADVGIGIYAITDRPDPETRVSGNTLVAVRLARRLLTTNGAFLAIGDEDAYESLNLRDYLGMRPTTDDIAALNSAMAQVLSTEERCSEVTASATFAAGHLAVAASGTAADGPFAFVIELSALTGARLREIT